MTPDSDVSTVNSSTRPAGTKFIHTLTAGALADYVQQVFAEQLAALDGNDIEY